MAAVIRLAALVAVALLGFAGGVCADGLQRFRHEIEPRFAPGALAYESATTLGHSGFALAKVTLRETGRTRIQQEFDGIRAERIVVEDIDFDRLAIGEAPYFARIRLNGATPLSRPGYDAWAETLAAAGRADIRLDYRFDPIGRTLTVERFEFVIPGETRLSLEIVLERVRSLSLADREQWTSAVLRAAKLVVDDKELLRELVRVRAKELRKSQAQLVREWTRSIASAAEGRGARTQAAADAVVSLVQDYRRPKGPLTASLLPSRPLSFGQVAAAMIAPDPAQMLGLSIAYRGTRPGAAADALGRP
jgi:hypothetical protein